MTKTLNTKSQIAAVICDFVIKFRSKTPKNSIERD